MYVYSFIARFLFVHNIGKQASEYTVFRNLVHLYESVAYKNPYGTGKTNTKTSREMGYYQQEYCLHFHRWYSNIICEAVLKMQEKAFVVIRIAIGKLSWSNYFTLRKR